MARLQNEKKKEKIQQDLGSSGGKGIGSGITKKETQLKAARFRMSSEGNVANKGICRRPPCLFMRVILKWKRTT